MYKVFIENTPLVFEKGKESYPTVLKTYLPSLQLKEYEDFVRTVKNASPDELYVHSNNPKACKKDFFKYFTPVHAAGGLVYSLEKEAFLFIKRHNKWDLPKGKVEKGETHEQAAVREVEEECGISGLILKEHLTTTYHTFFSYGKHILKLSDWFYMEYHGNEKPTPQTEEDITQVEWFKKKELNLVLENTYGNIIDVVQRLNY